MVSKILLGLEVTPRQAYYIAAAMAFIAVFNWPYGYYMSLRWIVTVTCVLASIDFFSQHRSQWAWAMLVTAGVFNPIWKVSFERETWRILDVACGILLILAERSQAADKR